MSAKLNMTQMQEVNRLLETIDDDPELVLFHLIHDRDLNARIMMKLAEDKTGGDTVAAMRLVKEIESQLE